MKILSFFLIVCLPLYQKSVFNLKWPFLHLSMSAKVVIDCFFHVNIIYGDNAIQTYINISVLKWTYRWIFMILIPFQHLLDVTYATLAVSEVCFYTRILVILRHIFVTFCIALEYIVQQLANSQCSCQTLLLSKYHNSLNFFWFLRQWQQQLIFKFKIVNFFLIYVVHFNIIFQ